LGRTCLGNVMRRELTGLALFMCSVVTWPSAAAEDTLPHFTRAQSVINAYQVMCTLELPNFDHLDAKATAMKMHLQSSTSSPSANNTVTRRKTWIGALTSGPFILLIDEMSGAKGRSTACAVAVDVPDIEAFRTEAVSMLKLRDVPAPEFGHDGSRSYVWEPAYGPGTTVIMRDFTPVKRPGIMVKLLSTVAPNTANAQESTDMARDYAIALNRDTVRFPPGAFINFEGAKAQGNHVFINYVVSDAGGFASFKSNGESAKAATAKHICEGADYRYLKYGVEIHWIYSLLKPADKFEFVVNKQSCAQK
jgi:hypothetical protein